MKRILFFGLSALMFNAGYAQPGANRYFDNWHISETIRIHWDGSGTPSVDPASSPSINGLVVSVSDPISGQLEFIAANYLHDSLSQPMPLGSGLFGPFVGALPHPGDLSQYFIFPMKSDSLFVAVVDMDLNNGLGDLIGTPTLLSGGMSEQVTAFSSPDGGRHTLVTRKFGTADLYLWSVDAVNGFITNPTIVTIGSSTSGTPGSVRAFKVSPSNDRIAFIEDDSYTLWVQESDAATLQFEQAVRIGFTDQLWDLEFSAENDKLYVTDLNSGGGQLFQLDVSTLDSALMTNLRDTVDAWSDTLPPGVELHLQLGPDAKIYGIFGSGSDTALLVIQNPAADGVACGVTVAGLSLNGGAIWNPLFPWQFWPRSNTVGIHDEPFTFRPLATLSPNPITDHGLLTCPSGILVRSLRWYDLTGRTVRVEKAILSGQGYLVSTQGLPSGSYVLVPTTDQGDMTPVRVVVDAR